MSVDAECARVFCVGLGCIQSHTRDLHSRSNFARLEGQFRDDIGLASLHAGVCVLLLAAIIEMSPLLSFVQLQANIGNMDIKRELQRMIVGNLVLTQLQAIVVGFFAALVSIAMGWVPQGHLNLRHALVLCSSSTSTASIASLGLGMHRSSRFQRTRANPLPARLGAIMVIVVVVSHKCRVNPDNIATPIAASLGDLTTLAILASIGGFFFRIIGKAEHRRSPTSLHIPSVQTIIPGCPS